MAEEFALRIATPQDEAAVSELLQACYPALMPTRYDDTTLAAALPRMTRANPALLAAGTFFVAEAGNGGIVGCGGWTRERPGKGDIVPELGHIRHFATHPDWTGRSIGRSILSLCADTARSAGVTRFLCYASLNAEGFYKALGFAPLNRIDIPMGPDTVFPVVMMERSI